MIADGLTTAIDLYKYAESDVSSLWGLYSGAALALLGYILGSKTSVPGRAKIGLGAVFLIFAVSNALALWRAQSIGYAAVQFIAAQPRGDAASLSPLLSELTMHAPQVVVGFQLFLTLCALGAIYGAHRHEKYAKTDPSL